MERGPLGLLGAKWTMFDAWRSENHLADEAYSVEYNVTQLRSTDRPVIASVGGMGFYMGFVVCPDRMPFIDAVEWMYFKAWLTDDVDPAACCFIYSSDRGRVSWRIYARTPAGAVYYFT